MPGVTSVAPIRLAPLRIDGSSASAIAVDPRAIEENVRVTVNAGSLESINSGQVMISQTAAEDEAGRSATSCPRPRSG